jgi:hypothetical protein
MAQELQYLLGKHKALSSNYHQQKKKKKRNTQFLKMSKRSGSFIKDIL